MEKEVTGALATNESKRATEKMFICKGEE